MTLKPRGVDGKRVINQPPPSVFRVLSQVRDDAMAAGPSEPQLQSQAAAPRWPLAASAAALDEVALLVQRETLRRTTKNNGNIAGWWRVAGPHVTVWQGRDAPLEKDTTRPTTHKRRHGDSGISTGSPGLQW